MGTFKDQTAADIAAVFFNPDFFAEWATYNGAEILVIPEIGMGDIRQTNAEQRSEMAYFSVQAVDVSNPQSGDVIVYNGQEWSYDSLAESDGLIHRIKCVSEDSATILSR